MTPILAKILTSDLLTAGPYYLERVYFEFQRRRSRFCSLPSRTKRDEQEERVKQKPAGGCYLWEEKIKNCDLKFALKPC